LQNSIFLQQLELKDKNKSHMIPDYSINNKKYQGRTPIPENGVIEARPSHLKVMLGDAAPESHTPTTSLAL
jgi:hypothetical protein